MFEVLLVCILMSQAPNSEIIEEKGFGRNVVKVEFMLSEVELSMAMLAKLEERLETAKTELERLKQKGVPDSQLQAKQTRRLIEFLEPEIKKLEKKVDNSTSEILREVRQLLGRALNSRKLEK